MSRPEWQAFPARTASFPTRRQAERWAKTIEADMIEGKHFRSAEARRRTVAEAIDRYVAEELPKKRAGDMHRQPSLVEEKSRASEACGRHSADPC
jgi:hypothetical protein